VEYVAPGGFFPEGPHIHRIQEAFRENYQPTAPPQQYLGGMPGIQHGYYLRLLRIACSYQAYRMPSS
jgi:hypothetical protein